MIRGGRQLNAMGVGLAALAATVLVGGCAEQPWRRSDGAVVTGKIDFQKEPTTGRQYHLYVPTTYNPKRAYPLVLTAQGTFPFDQAAGQRDRWIDVAEQFGFIICSADFDGATGLLGFPADRPPAELVRDDKAALAILEELYQRYNIDRDAIMITGWSGGGFPAHYIGLNHPEIFRCIVGRTANFNSRIVTDEVALRARHMHVYCFFGQGDLPGFADYNREANFWYTLRGFRNFVINELPGGHNPNQLEAARYFRNLVTKWPAIEIDASATRGPAPLTVTFKARVRDPDSPDGRVDSVLWNFGDNAVSAQPEVVHTYHRPGIYNVFLTVKDLDGHIEYKQAWIQAD